MKEREYYLKAVNKLIRSDIKSDIKNNINKSEKDYMSCCLEYLNKLHNGWDPNKDRWYFGRNNKNDEAYALWVDAKQELSDMIISAIKASKSQQMQTNINAVTAKALISIAMKDAGLEYIYTAQQFRAKIEVKISSKSKLTFFVGYKKLQDELSSLVESAKAIKENMVKLGGNATIKKIFSTDSFEGSQA
jgi:hypothetical protein